MNNTLVIIPHYNKLKLLKECIYHLNLENDAQFSVLIVDNGSTDGSSEYIQELVATDSRFHCILLSENTGFAIAVNKGLTYSIENEYDYSILLNNDAFICDDFVKNLTVSIGKSDDIFAVSSLMLRFDDKNKIDSYGDYYNVLGFAFQGHLLEGIDDISDAETPFSACGGASIYNNKILSKVGLFDEMFFAYLEDVDISYRAKLYGYKISTCKLAKCFHLGSATTGSKYNKFKVRTSARNNIFLIYKNMPSWQIAINIIPIFIGHFIKLVFFMLKGFAYDYVAGISDGIKSLKFVDRVDFNKVSIHRIILIEIELIVNTFEYIINFVKRHLK